MLECYLSNNSGEFSQLKSWFYTHASRLHHSLAFCLFSSFPSLQMCTFPNLSLFVLNSLLPFFLPICSYCHSILLSLTFSLFLLLYSLCFSLLGSILTPLNARALINQCRVALFHRDPKQLVSFPVCLCLPVCCRCTSVCLFKWHARLHAMSFAELCKSVKYVAVRIVWRMLHGGFVPNQFATLHASRNMQKNVFVMTRYTLPRSTLG